jgi:hypothetical protein
LALVASSRPARAEPLPVSIQVDACVPVDRAQLRRLLSIELGGARVREPNAATRVEVNCIEQGIELRLWDAVTGKSMQRLLPADSFRDASSTRMLALVVAEFVVASWIELNVREQVTPPLRPSVTPEVRRSVERVVTAHAELPITEQHALQPEAEETSLSLSFSSQFWTAQSTLFLGAGIRWLHAIPPYLALTAGAEVASASNDVGEGSVDAVTGSLEFALALCARFAPFTLYSGPGGRVGLASLQGRSTQSELRGFRFSALYGGPIWWNRIEYRASARLRVTLDLAAGWTTLPVRGTGPTNGTSADVFALEGFSLTSALGLALTL